MSNYIESLSSLRALVRAHKLEDEAARINRRHSSLYVYTPLFGDPVCFKNMRSALYYVVVRRCFPHLEDNLCAEHWQEAGHAQIWTAHGWKHLEVYDCFCQAFPRR